MLWEYYGKNKYVSILWVLTKNQLNQKTHTIARYGKLVPKDFLIYGNSVHGKKMGIPIYFPLIDFERFFLCYTLAYLIKLRIVSF